MVFEETPKENGTTLEEKAGIMTDTYKDIKEDKKRKGTRKKDPWENIEKFEGIHEDHKEHFVEPKNRIQAFGRGFIDSYIEGTRLGRAHSNNNPYIFHNFHWSRINFYTELPKYKRNQYIIGSILGDLSGGLMLKWINSARCVTVNGSKEIKESIKNNFNAPAIKSFAKYRNPIPGMRNVNLYMPHIFVPNITYVDFESAKRAGIEFVAVDMDITLSEHGSYKILDKFIPSIKKAQNVFGPENVWIESNRIGLKKNKKGMELVELLKEESERQLGYPLNIFIHNEMKPNGGDEFRKQTGYDMSKGMMIGDKSATDNLFGNLNSMLVVQVAYFPPKSHCGKFNYDGHRLRARGDITQIMYFAKDGKKAPEHNIVNEEAIKKIAPYNTLPMAHILKSKIFYSLSEFTRYYPCGLVNPICADPKYEQPIPDFMDDFGDYMSEEPRDIISKMDALITTYEKFLGAPTPALDIINSNNGDESKDLNFGQRFELWKVIRTNREAEKFYKSIR